MTKNKKLYRTIGVVPLGAVVRLTQNSAEHYAKKTKFVGCVSMKDMGYYTQVKDLSDQKTYWIENATYVYWITK